MNDWKISGTGYLICDDRVVFDRPVSELEKLFHRIQTEKDEAVKEIQTLKQSLDLWIEGLPIKDNIVLVVKGFGLSLDAVHYLAKGFEEKNLKIQIICLSDNQEIHALDEVTMNRMGWERKKTMEEKIDEEKMKIRNGG